MKGFSDVGTPTLIFAAAGLPLLRDGKAGKEHTLRAVDSLAVTLVTSELLKAAIKENRPNGSGRDSFPSNHTALAFAAATMASAYHPKEAPLWYGGAALIGWSRVSLREHHTYDVLAGALLGYGVSRLELSQPHGLVLTPWISRGAHGESNAGFALSGHF